MMKNKYAAEFFWSDDDEAYVAVVPDLPGCSAIGDTRAEAAAEIEDAIASWIEAAHAAGNPVPEPSPRAEFDTYSGKLLLRMPKELHRDLQVCAKTQGTSLNSYVCFLLTQRHYHAHAIKELASSLRWQSFGFSSGTTTQHVIQLASVTNLNEPSTIHGTTGGQHLDSVVTPLAIFGTSQNA